MLLDFIVKIFCQNTLPRFFLFYGLVFNTQNTLLYSVFCQFILVIFYRRCTYFLSRIKSKSIAFFCTIMLLHFATNVCQLIFKTKCFSRKNCLNFDFNTLFSMYDYKSFGVI